MKFFPKVISFLVFFSVALFAQTVTTPRVSPPAEVKQGVGLAYVGITYHSPAANGRKVWGELVPYGSIWRAGANDNTVVTFSHDAKVEGKKIAAGSYGFHVIPNENEWTLIFNSVNSAWGSFFYDQSKDVLRVRVKTEEAPHRENLAYYFDNISTSKVTAYLDWAGKRASFSVVYDDKAVTVESFRSELVSLAWYNWTGPWQAANYCINNNTNLEEAKTWLERSITLNRNFSNLSTKAALLELEVKDEEAIKIKAEAFDIATEAQLNAYGYQRMGAGDLDEALRVFKMNVKNHPESWNVYDSYAEALDKKGDIVNAEKNYKKALEMAPENQKGRIRGILTRYEGAN